MTEWLEGVYALEVVAAAGRRNSGKHAILVATATHCFGARSRIRYTRSYYGLSIHRLSLR
ncbi:MAG: hypothetical protein LUD15_11360 [Bacteroides sp.]|nr:hypothetical protein [Bacteroides sp.]